MRKLFLLIPFLLITLLSSGTFLAAPSIPPFKDSHRQRMDRFSHQVEILRESLRIPGLSVGVVQNGQLGWSKGYGFADVENRTPATKRTPYPIASLTKTFTSTLIMQLVEEGRLNLEDPMSKYSDEFKTEIPTVRHVLTHTSDGDPGKYYQYNHGRFGQLTPVIEKISGQHLQRILVDRILDRLEMRHTITGTDSIEWLRGLQEAMTDRRMNRYQQTLQKMAKLYKSNELAQPVAINFTTLGVTAAGGLISTVEDISKYLIAIDRNELIRKETQEKAFTQTQSTEGQLLPYGFGWFVQEINGLKIAWHYGYLPGAASCLVIKVLDKDISLILLANSDALSAPFNERLISGDLLGSPFATTFLRIFVAQDSFPERIEDPDWRLPSQEFMDQTIRFSETNKEYCYDDEITAHAYIQRWFESAALRRAKNNQNQY